AAGGVGRSAGLGGVTTGDRTPRTEPLKRPCLTLADSDTSLSCSSLLRDNGGCPGRTRERADRSMAHTPHINPKGIPLLNVGRDVHGRFTKANPGGPGNPFARKVAALRKALLDSVSEQDVKEMVEVLKQQARQGDKAAIKLILQYCVGKPAPPNDPDRMDVDEWDRLQQMRVSEQQFEKTIQSVPACVACDTPEPHWPCELQAGPAAEPVPYAHSQLRASGQPSTAPDKPSKDPPDGAQPQAPPQHGAAAASQKGQPNAQGEPGAERPSPAKGKRSRTIGVSRPAGRGATVTHRPSHRHQTGETARGNGRLRSIRNGCGSRPSRRGRPGASLLDAESRP